MQTRAKIIVEGKVQGVGYRDFVDRIASDLGLTGRVRNLEDKSVEIICEGPKEIIENFLKLIKVEKYPIKVLNLKIEYNAPTNEFSDFRVVFGNKDDETFERLGLGALYIQEVNQSIQGVNQSIVGVKISVDEVKQSVNGVGQKVDSLRKETKTNFDRMDKKYDKISQTLTELIVKQEVQHEKLIDELRQDRKETREDMRNLINSVLEVAKK